tara:strand:- start:11396 stop:11647 length:252 start_codon:yes stop_codon:yes gene_type:complete
MNQIKQTKSFRVSDGLWELVEKTAAEQGKKPSEVIVESLASYCGEVIRRDRALSNQEIASLMIKVKAIEAETQKIKGALKTKE